MPCRWVLFGDGVPKLIVIQFGGKNMDIYRGMKKVWVDDGRVRRMIADGPFWVIGV
jgi:hypothetical protein